MKTHQLPRPDTHSQAENTLNVISRQIRTSLLRDFKAMKVRYISSDEGKLHTFAGHIIIIAFILVLYRLSHYRN